MKVVASVLPQWEKEEWIRFAIMLSISLFLFFAWNYAFAADGAEFNDANTKVEGYVKGNLGKLAALLTVAVGIFMAGFKKDWSYLMNAVLIGIVVGILIGIINTAFTATI